MTSTWYAIILGCLVPIVQSQAAGIDEFVRDQMEARHVPGTSVAVVKEGKVILAKGYGVANVELSVPATEHTAYQWASVSKQFTATATMMLVADGQLSLDAKVVCLLEGLPQGWSNVTVRHLLNHTSGIKSYTSLPDFFKSARKDFQKQEIINLVTNAPLEFQPGEKWNYNNTGYFLLGMVIEKAAGRDYPNILKERIFDRLAMGTARVNDLKDIIPNRAHGYSWEKGKFVNGEYVSPTQPFSAGALIGTVLDLAKWDAALYGEDLVKRSVLDEMWKPTRLEDGKTKDYGYGWTIDSYRTRPRIQHGGGIPGFNTFIERFVEDKITVIVLCNSDTGAAESIANGIAEYFIPALAENAPKPISDTDPNTTAFVKKVLESLAEGKGDKEWFTEEAQKFFFPDRIKEGKEMFGSNGELRSLELMEEKQGGKNRIRIYKAVFGKTGLRMTMTLAEDGKVAGVGVRPE